MTRPDYRCQAAEPEPETCTAPIVNSPEPPPNNAQLREDLKGLEAQDALGDLCGDELIRAFGGDPATEVERRLCRAGLPTIGPDGTVWSALIEILDRIEDHAVRAQFAGVGS